LNDTVDEVARYRKEMPNTHTTFAVQFGGITFVCLKCEDIPFIGPKLFLAQDEEVKESMWLGKALRRQRVQAHMEELAASRKSKKEEEKPAGGSDVRMAPLL
jgi:hypothetical protein